MSDVFSIKKVKELPEKVALELTGDDILIIEDEHNTCQIKLSELSTYIKNGLIDKDSFNELMTETLSELLTRLDKAESIYPFKINNIIKALPVNLPGKEQETSDKYIQNQNNIEVTFSKKTINEYDLVITEKAELNSYYSGGSITDEHKWYGVILEFNINNNLISYDKTKSSGNWAEIYSIDSSEKTDVSIFNGVDLNTASQEDIDKTLNSIIVWLRADDEKQTFCFMDNQQSIKYVINEDTHEIEEIEFEDVPNIVKLNISVEEYVPEIIDETEEKQTYAVYQWDKITGCEPEINIKDDILYIEFNGNISYTSQDVDDIHTSGHWVGITITPPIGFDTSDEQYPKIYYNDVLNIEGWKNLFKQDEDGNVITEDISKANLFLMFTELNRDTLCTIDWGIGYIDNVVITVKNGTLLYPPIYNL